MSDATVESDLDVEFYQSWYRDLSGMCEEELSRHWQDYGIDEGRFPNFAALLNGRGIDAAQVEEVEYEFYTQHYHDIRDSEIDNGYEARLHFVLHGKGEDRYPSLAQWLLSQNVSERAASGVAIATIKRLNEDLGLGFESADILDNLYGKTTHPIQLAGSAAQTADIYRELAENQLRYEHYDAAQQLLRTSLYYEPQPRTLELLGDASFKLGDHRRAVVCYRSALESGLNSRSLSRRLAQSILKCQDARGALDVVLQAVERNADWSGMTDTLDERVREFWVDSQAEFTLLAERNQRQRLVDSVAGTTGFIYDCYARLFGSEPVTQPSVNLDRVLIVGDFHIAQCVRYRIDQKVEQLERAGKTVTTIPWDRLQRKDLWNELVFHDVVIFYRVPAEPVILKAMALVNATGKLSFYEVDDLLIDPVFPPDLRTYGGAVDIGTYVSITRDVAVFRAAATHCRFGIASTRPLADALADLVTEGRCHVHRNGLDSLNYQAGCSDADPATINLFYGSGTLSHNSDFVQLALPAIGRILDEHDNVRLIIVGDRRLPVGFLDRHGKRVRLLPRVRNVVAYWSLLEKAHINLAVLFDDRANGAKSEIKWLEAAVLGVPSVVSTTENYRDVLTDGEDALLCASAEEWYEKLQQLISHPELRQRIAARARERALENYSAEALGSSLAAFISDCAPRPGCSGKRRKIALVNVFFPPQALGGATRVLADNFEVLRRQYADRYELSVFTTDNDQREPYGMSAYGHASVRVYRSTIKYKVNMDWNPRDPVMGQAFARYLELERPDLVHFHCVQRLTGSAVEAAREAGVPYVVTLHDAWWISDFQFLVAPDGQVFPDGHPELYEPHPLPPGITFDESVDRRTYLAGLLHGAAALLTVSERFAELHRRNGFPGVRAIPNGISEYTEWLPKDTSARERLVCAHVGGMAEHKGYFLLRHAITAAQPRHMEMLVVDHAKPEGFSSAEDWGGVPVRVIGKVRQQQVPQLLRGVDVLFAPSTWPESFGLVTREANACGCWVVASSMGAIGEDVVEGESGFVVDPDLESLQRVIQRLDQDFRFFKQNHAVVSARYVSDQVRALDGVYEEVLQS